MQINNNLVPYNGVQGTGIREQDALRTEREARVASSQRPSDNASADIDAEALERKGQEIQQSRVQRLNDIESAPLKTQQALSAYQDTALATQPENGFGELVGVDLFV